MMLANFSFCVCLIRGRALLFCSLLVKGVLMSVVKTSEAVCVGHPDKLCDLVADQILDDILYGDRNARVAVEVMAAGRRLRTNNDCRYQQERPLLLTSPDLLRQNPLRGMRWLVRVENLAFRNKIRKTHLAVQPQIRPRHPMRQANPQRTGHQIFIPESTPTNSSDR